MKKFSYKLESLLKYKNDLKEKLLLEYSEVVKSRVNIKNKIDSKRKELGEINFFLKGRSHSVEYLKQLYFFENLNEEIKKLEKDLLVIIEEEDRKFRIFLNAKKEVDILMKHKEIKEIKYNNEMNHINEKIIEDIVMDRYLKRNST